MLSPCFSLVLTRTTRCGAPPGPSKGRARLPARQWNAGSRSKPGAAWTILTNSLSPEIFFAKLRNYPLDISDSLYIVSDMKTTASLQQLEQRIQSIKTQLASLGDMRPGSLSQQYNVCGKPRCRCKDPVHPRRHGPYYQLSWVHQGKSTTQFIRRPCVPQVKAELANFKKFRQLTEHWITLALRRAKMKLHAASKDEAKPIPTTSALVGK
jgi:hypothetical protein